MKILKDEELLTILGGSISATMLNAVSRLITTIMDLGRIIGSTIYRISSKNYCR